MRPAGCEAELLRRLARTPFLDRLEMVCLSGWSRSAVYEAVERLEQGGLVASIPHAADLTPPARRYCVTAHGVRRLAEVNGGTVDGLLRSRPVSQQWRRILLERLDAIASVYRLASTVVSAARPIGLRLYRAAPLDAALLLPGGRTLGVVRQGPAADRTAFAKRLWRLGQGLLPGAVLVLASDEVRLRHARRLLVGTPVNALLALERDAVLAGAAAPVWRPPSGGARLDLGYVLERLRPGGELREEELPSKASLPGDIAADAAHALPALLKPAEKRALDLLAGWPWMLQRDMADLLGVSETRVSRLMNPLEGFGLVTRSPAAGGRLAPYLRYYSSHRPTDDHGARPAVLVVFDDDIAATHFLTLAAREMERLRVAVPLWVSNRKIIEALGPLGRAWLTPGDWEPAHLPLNG